MAKGFSEEQRERIFQDMLQACQQSWTRVGYRKTNVESLCKNVGIAKGSFYLFFESKEELFAETIYQLQSELLNKINECMESEHGVKGIVDALKVVYKAYADNNFLYQANSEDYWALLSKLSSKQAERLNKISSESKDIFIHPPYARLLISEELAVSVVYSLIMMVKNKEIFPANHEETFLYVVNEMVNKMYE